ncbi:MAG: hypothetical protein PHU77_10185 [Simplicispira sp.]|nr:hypothetical protein [Simplicispira sp.]
MRTAMPGGQKRVWRVCAPQRRRREKIARYFTHTQDNPMDAEQINQIGNTLIDLSERTQELRGYL